MSINHKRKESQYFQAVSEIISNHITNVNVSLATVTGVKLSNDNSHLKVFVTFMNSENKSLANLKHASSFVRSQLARSVSNRITPSVHFEIDASPEHGRKIDEIFAEIKRKRDEGEKI